MTIKDCPNCGGTHYGDVECPLLEKNMGEPCVMCGERTCYCCSDCGIDSAGREKVYVCTKDACRTEHEKKHTDQTAFQRNCRVQARYDELRHLGKHGHYETMFQVVREEVERLTSPPSGGRSP